MREWRTPTLTVIEGGSQRVWVNHYNGRPPSPWYTVYPEKTVWVTLLTQWFNKGFLWIIIGAPWIPFRLPANTTLSLDYRPYPWRAPFFFSIIETLLFLTQRKLPIFLHNHTVFSRSINKKSRTIEWKTKYFTKIKDYNLDCLFGFFSFDVSRCVTVRRSETLARNTRLIGKKPGVFFGVGVETFKIVFTPNETWWGHTAQ